MKNENDLTFSFFIFQVLRKINWHSGTRILTAGVRDPKSSRCRDNSDFLLVRIFHQLENQQNFPNRFTVLNIHLLLKKFERIFQWKLCENS